MNPRITGMARPDMESRHGRKTALRRTAATADGRRTTRRIALLAAAVLSVLGASGSTRAVAQSPPPSASAGELREQLARLQRTATLLERQVQLARGADFYLVLDPASSDLALMLRGAELQRYEILGLQIGRPRVAWVRRADTQPWQGVIWSRGELDPPRPSDRLVIQAAEPGREGEEAAPVIPPTAEELYTVPSRYHIRFPGGPSIEIRPREADASLSRTARLGIWWSAKWRDTLAALGWRARDAVRLRVVLNRADAESLYRALPPATSLLVLTGEQKK